MATWLIQQYEFLSHNNTYSTSHRGVLGMPLGYSDVSAQTAPHISLVQHAAGSQDPEPGELGLGAGSQDAQPGGDNQWR